jgi:hypothetical protein
MPTPLASNILKRSRAKTIDETPNDKSNNNKPAQKNAQARKKKKREGERTKWTDEMEKLLLEHLVDAQNTGQG